MNLYRILSVLVARNLEVMVSMLYGLQLKSHTIILQLHLSSLMFLFVLFREKSKQM